jgi:CRP-like cAMP-binding protein
MIKNQVLYREGDPAEYVYIIKSGQFEVTKMLVHKNVGLSAISNNGNEKDSTKEIFKNPLKA